MPRIEDQVAAAYQGVNVCELAEARRLQNQSWTRVVVSLGDRPWTVNTSAFTATIETLRSDPALAAADNLIDQTKEQTSWAKRIRDRHDYERDRTSAAVFTKGLFGVMAGLVAQRAYGMKRFYKKNA